MIRYAAVLGGIVLALVVVADPVAGTVPPPGGPRLAFVREGPPLPAEELRSVGLGGDDSFMLARGQNSTSGIFESVSWSRDGTRLALGGMGLVRTVGDAGGPQRVVRGTRGGFNPVFSPNGETIAFARFRIRRRAPNQPFYVSVSVWIADAQGGGSRQLTPWKDALFIVPFSFSPDGSTLAAVRKRRGSSPEVISVSLADGRRSVIVGNATEPAYSPDGSRIAFVRLRRRPRPKRLGPGHVFGGDLFLITANGSQLRQLTFTPAKREESPSWDPSGERLAYTQYPSQLTWKALGGIGSSIIEINADGTCRHRLLFTYGLSYRAAAWQPGPGRGAGRIEC